MPAPISYSHKVLQLMSEARKSGKEKLLRPEFKKSIFSYL
jgi:S-adenosylmethionine synthetase